MSVIEARIRTNEHRLRGMAAGLVALAVATGVGLAIRGPELAVTIGLAGLPVAPIFGWLFAPAVVSAPAWRLPLVIVAVGVVVANVGWLLWFGFLTALFLLLAPLLVPLWLPAIAITIPIAARWAVLVRALGPDGPVAHLGGFVTKPLDGARSRPLNASAARFFMKRIGRPPGKPRRSRC